MKQKSKSIKHIELNEKVNKGNIIREKNNKTKSNNTKNELANLINLVGISTNDYSHNFNTNTYKNIKLKEKLMKLVYKQGKKSKIKDRNGKILTLDTNNSNKENISILSNRNHQRNKNEFLIENNKTELKIGSIKNYIEGNETKRNKKNNKSRTITFYNDCISEKLRTLDTRNKNKIDIELSQNDESYFNLNGARYKGAISFNNFIKNKNNVTSNDNDKNEYSFINKLKERNNSYRNKKRLSLDSDENILYNDKNKTKNKNNIISYNFRNSRSKIFNENTFSTSVDKDIPMNRNSLQMLEILKNSKSTRIILKPNETLMNNKNEKNKKEEEQKIVKKEDDKSKKKRRSIFNEIMDEVSKEKNYVQKIVHMKLIQGMKLLRQNSHRQFKVKYNSKTYEHSSINKDKEILTLPNKINENNEINSNVLRASFISNKPEKNINYIKISNSCKNLDENRCVKIKKIKLDKLKNKLKRDSFKYCPTDNNKSINISLSLNNKIININNHKIYAPKKPPLSKKRSIELSSIPFCYPNPIKNIPKHSVISPINPTSPIIYKKSHEQNKSFGKQISINNSIKTFNETSISDINKIEKSNKLEINTNTESNINYNRESTKPNIKYILYNKVRIKKDSSKIKKTNLNNSRYKTIRYVKKNSSKIKRIEDSLEKDKDKENENKNDNTNTNKMMKIKEIQFGILKKNNFKKSLNNLDKTEPINFNLNDPINNFNKQISLNQYKTFLSHDMNDLTDIPNYDFSKKNILSITSQQQSNNDDEITVQTGTCHIGYNFSYDYDKLTNNNNYNDISNDNESIKLNYIKDELKGKEQVYNLLNFEDLLIIEDKLNLVLIVLEQGNKSFKEYFDLIIYFFSSNLLDKLEQLFKYFKKDTNDMQLFINYSIIFILICYDFAQNSISVNIDNNYNLIEIFQLIYRNILLVINSIKNKIEFENSDNYKIRLIELSKIGLLIKDKLFNIDNDITLIKEILHNNTNSIVIKINNIINKIKYSDEKYTNKIFHDIKNNTFSELYDFFLDKILKEDFIGCSVLAYSYLKQKNNFVTSREPYLRSKNKKKYSLVLDLDETLIYFKFNNDEGKEGILKLRPGVFTFLEKISEFYEIILFTEASEAYIKLMMEVFNNHKKNKKYFDFILYRQYASIEGNDFVKDLSRLGRPLNRTIIIDNIQKNFYKQKNNGILIKPFLGEDKNDTALIDLIPILTNIAKDEIDVKNGIMKYRDEIITKITTNLFRRGKKIVVN